MSQTHPMTRLEVVDIETLEVTKAVYMTTQDPKQIQAMSDSLLRNVNTFQFFVRSAPSAGPVAAPLAGIPTWQERRADWFKRNSQKREGPPSNEPFMLAEIKDLRVASAALQATAPGA